MAKENEINIQEIEKHLDSREKALNERERQVSDLERTKKELEKKYNDKLGEVRKLEEDILKEQTLELKKSRQELESVNSQLENVKKELIKKSEKLNEEQLTFESKLSQYKNSKLQKIEQELIAKIEADIKKIEMNYQQFLGTSVNTVNWSNKKLEDAFDKINAEFKSLLETEEKIINTRKKDLENAIKTYEDSIAKIEKIEEMSAKLNLKEIHLAKKEEMIVRIIEEEVMKRYDEIINEKEETEKRLESYKTKYNEIVKDYDNIRIEYMSNDNFEKKQLISERDRFLKQLEFCQKHHKDYSSEQYKDLEKKASLYENTIAENNKLRLEMNDLSNQVQTLKNEQFNSDSLKFKNDTLENTIKVERQMLVQLQTEIENLSSRIENKKTGIMAAEAIETAVADFVALSKNTNESIDENKWLNKIIESCSNSGYAFSKRLYYSFHTSLKTNDMSPLTVLTGVSGTGKSKLPQLYSKFGGIYFLSIPVKPDWDSPQSFFGYFNSIEKRFDATTLLKALVMFQANKSKSPTKEKITDLSDRVLIVLLDEMNLAHIEQYFSDLLSKLEERRGEFNDVSFEVDLGAGNDKYSIVLTNNVIWVGTMNEDETTKSLSDKVIDRGNVISFPRPKEFQRYNYKNNKVSTPDMITRIAWEKWVNSKVELTDEETKKFMEIVIDINENLKFVNRALGHRVWQSIENYMMSHPIVNEYKSDNNKREIALKYAFEEALVHKVMPKLRGISTDGSEREECLDKIENILKDNDLTILGDFQHAMESVTGTFIWDSAMYLDNEYDDLK